MKSLDYPFELSALESDEVRCLRCPPPPFLLPSNPNSPGFRTMSRPPASASAASAQVRRPAAAQFPGLPSLLRTGSSSGSSSLPTGRAPASAVPSHLLGSSSSSSSSSIGKGTPGTKEKASLPARTSKTSKKLVVLPDKVQSQPIQSYPGTSRTDHRPSAPPRADGGADSDRREQEDGDERSEAERMTKEERERNGFGRLTAYGELELPLFLSHRDSASSIG